MSKGDEYGIGSPTTRVPGDSLAVDTLLAKSDIYSSIIPLVRDTYPFSLFPTRHLPPVPTATSIPDYSSTRYEQLNRQRPDKTAGLQQLDFI